MKYLSFLNLSNVDNINCDSGYIFQTQLGNSLIELGHNYTLVIPIRLSNSLIEYKFHNFGTNKFQVRFSFDWNKIADLIKEVKPDIIISNQPELSANLKATLLSENINSKLYTYVHYYPFSILPSGNIVFDPSLNNDGFCESIIFSFVAGLLASDKIFVHSKYGEYLLNFLINRHNVQLNKREIIILPPPFDSYISQGNQIGTDNTILYNHRLYKQYGTEFLIDFANTISSHFDWKILVTDLLYNRNRNRKNLDKTVDKYKADLSMLSNVEIRIDGNDREIYRNIICSSRISLAPYRQNCTWSMSVVDCMSVGVPVVAPNFAWFSEFIPHELLFNSLDELIKISKQLFRDKIFYKDMSTTVKALILSNERLDSYKSALLLTRL